MRVVFNTAGQESLLDNLRTGLAAGTPLRGVYGVHGQPPDRQVDGSDRLTLLLPPFNAQV